MVGLNKSCIAASAWLRAQDNTTKSLLTLSAPTDAFCPISRKNIDAAPKMSILQIYRYFPVLEMTFCVDARNCPSRSRWEANKHPPPGENIVSEDSSNFSLFCRPCDLIKRFLLPTNISNRDIAVGQFKIIMYPAYVVLCVFDDFKYDELCERKSFSHWLRSLSFGDQRARPISNSQGYFQLMIIFCHLDSAAAPGQFLIIANQRRNLAMKEQRKTKK